MAAKSNRKMLVRWLTDAYAMEKTAEQILKRQSERVKSYPKIARKVEEHLTLTKSQAERVKGCLETLGEDPSTLKDTAGKFVGNMSAVMNAMSEDEIVANSISDFAFECFEIASYRSLIAAAKECGEQQIVSVCQEILQEEEEMAEWLQDQLPELTRAFLDRNATSGAEAKR